MIFSGVRGFSVLGVFVVAVQEVVWSARPRMNEGRRAGGRGGGEEKEVRLDG